MPTPCCRSKPGAVAAGEVTTPGFAANAVLLQEMPALENGWRVATMGFDVNVGLTANGLTVLRLDGLLTVREPLSKRRLPSAPLFASEDGVAATGRRPAARRGLHSPPAPGAPREGRKGAYGVAAHRVALPHGLAAPCHHAPKTPLGFRGLFRGSLGVFTPAFGALPCREEGASMRACALDGVPPALAGMAPRRKRPGWSSRGLFRGSLRSSRRWFGCLPARL